MEYLGYNYIVLYFFLLTTLILGLCAGRNINTLKEYAIANGSYEIGLLTMTFLATFGTSILSITTMTYNDGIILLFANFGIIGAFWYVGSFVVPKVMYYKNYLSVAHIIGSIYGKTARIFTAIIGCMFCLIVVGAKISAIGKISLNLLGINFYVGLILGGIILSLYSSSGGIKAVAITDVFQFSLALLLIFILASKVMMKIGGPIDILKQIKINQPEKLKIFSHPKFRHYSIIFLVWCLFPSFITSPPFIQRMLMAKSASVGRNMYYSSGIIYMVIRILTTIIGLGALLILPKNTSGYTVPALIKLLFSPKIEPFLLTSLIAILMSSADSFLNTAGILFTHDILSPIMENKSNKLKKVINIKMITLILGLLTIFVAAININKYELISFACSIIGTFTIPFIAGINNIKTSKKAFFYSIIMSQAVLIIAYFLFSYFSVWDLSNFESLGVATFVSIMASFIIFFYISYKHNKGLYFIKRQNNEEKEVLWNPIWNINSSLLVTEIKKDLRKSYCHSSIYCLIILIISLLKTLLITNFDSLKFKEFLVLNSLSFVLCPIILSKNFWSKKIKHIFLPLLWFFLIVYSISYSLLSTEIYRINGFFWFINYAFSIVFLAYLLKTRTLIFIYFVGILIGFCICYSLNLKYIFINEFIKLVLLGLVSHLFGVILKNKKSFLTKFIQIINNQKPKNILGNPEGRQKGLSVNSKNKALKAIKLYNTGEFLITDICNKTGISRPTFYRYLKYYDVKLRSEDRIE